MRLILSIAALMFLFSFLTNAQNEEGKDFRNLIECERHAHEGLVMARSNPLAEDYDLKYHRFEWTIDPNEYYIAGAVTSYFVPIEADFDEVHFDMTKSLSVDSILYHNNKLQFDHSESNILKIYLPAVIPQDQLDSLTVFYQGVPSGSGFGSFGQSTHSGSPIVWTLSEPYGAKDWWPTKQDLNDKIDSIDVFVTTQLGFKVASNGVLANETQNGEEVTYHWKHRYPIPAYLVAIAVTDYEVYSDWVPTDGEPIEVLNYVYPEYLNSAQNKTGAIVEIMQLFNELFGLYPFADEKYGHAQFGWGGGMEHQTMSFMGGFSHLLQAHELAHQWFGDKVTCGSWQDIWLNEGFATYLEGLNYAYGIGPTSWEAWLQSKRNQVTSSPGGSVFVKDTTSTGQIFNGRLSYSKGAMLLHMLRWTLGDEDFYQGVRNYLDDPDIAFGYARTKDLQAHLEAQGEIELTEFFDDWFYGEGYPSYLTEWWYQDDIIHLKVTQGTSHESVDFFEMPIPIQFFGEEQDTILVFDHTFSGQHFNAELPFKVLDVQFDPELWILSANDSTLVSTKNLQELQGQIQLSPNPTSDFIRLSTIQSDLKFKGIRLLNTQGQLLKEWPPSQENIAEINLSALANGIYYLLINTQKGAVSKQVIKH
ncbi:MAG: T9SS type A sorting domain-containing protein [Bacteroidetes bacterium]|nr:T9SS type A sorting domain-containing protein [Bacteroidota bacterium]